MRPMTILLVGIGLVAGVAKAQQPLAGAPPAAAPAATAAALPPAPQRHPVAFQYPPGYATRLKIHKIASFATLPLFATELALGNSLDNNPDQQGAKGAHAAIGTAIVGLFAVNTVTGVWNLRDRWDNPTDRKLVMAHSILMLVADAGFVATEMAAPHTHGPQAADFNAQAITHRNLAYFSVGVGTLGYALMLFRHH